MKQQLIRLAAVLLPLVVYGGTFATLKWGGDLRYIPSVFAVLFSLFYAMGWIDDIKTGKQLSEIGNNPATTAYVKALVVVGVLGLTLALLPFSILRFSMRLTGTTPVEVPA